MIACWNCGASATAARVAVETVIRGRSRDEGGPYRVFRCLACGVENGVLAGPRGGWLLYPLSGLAPPSVFDRILSARERSRLESSRAWWAVNRSRVERFRHGEDVPSEARPGPAPRAAPRPRAAPKPPPAPRPAPRPSPRPAQHPLPRTAATSGPRAVLGVPLDATLAEVRRAFRALAKRHHPDRDRTPGAAERFRAVRVAYEVLLAELED